MFMPCLEKWKPQTQRLPELQGPPATPRLLRYRSFGDKSKRNGGNTRLASWGRYELQVRQLGTKTYQGRHIYYIPPIESLLITTTSLAHSIIITVIRCLKQLTSTFILPHVELPPCPTTMTSCRTLSRKSEAISLIHPLFPDTPLNMPQLRLRVRRRG